MQRSPQSANERELSQVTFCLRMPEREDVFNGCPVLVGSVAALGNWQLGESLVGEKYENLWYVEIPITPDSNKFFFSWVLVDSEGHARLGRFGHHKVHLEYHQAEVWSVWGTPHTRMQYIRESGGSFVRFVLQYYDQHKLVPALIGSIQQLGNWSLDRVVKASPITHIWLAQAEVQPESSIFYNWVLLDAEGRCKGRDLGELRYLQAGLSDLQVEVVWGQAEQTVRWASLPQPPTLKGLRVKSVFPSASPPDPPALDPNSARAYHPVRRRVSILKKPSVLLEVEEEAEEEKEQFAIERKKKLDKEAEVKDNAPQTPDKIFARLTGGFKPKCEGRKERALASKMKEEAGTTSRPSKESVVSVTSYDGIQALQDMSPDQHKIIMNSEDLKALFDTFVRQAGSCDYPVVCSSSEQLVLDPEYLRITYGMPKEGSSLSLLSDQGMIGHWESMLDVDDYTFDVNIRTMGETSKSQSTSLPPPPTSLPRQQPPSPRPASSSHVQKKPGQMVEISMEKNDAADTVVKPALSKSEKSEKKPWSWSRIFRAITAEFTVPVDKSQQKVGVSGNDVEGKKKISWPWSRKSRKQPQDSKEYETHEENSKPVVPSREPSMNTTEDNRKNALRRIKANTECTATDEEPSGVTSLRYTSNSNVIKADSDTNIKARGLVKFFSDPLPRIPSKDRFRFQTMLSEQFCRAHKASLAHNLVRSVSLDALSERIHEKLLSSEDELSIIYTPVIPKLGVYIHQYVGKIIEQSIDLMNTHFVPATDHESGYNVQPRGTVQSSFSRHGMGALYYRADIVNSAVDLAYPYVQLRGHEASFVRNVRKYSNETARSRTSPGPTTRRKNGCLPHSSPEQTNLTDNEESENGVSANDMAYDRTSYVI